MGRLLENLLGGTRNLFLFTFVVVAFTIVGLSYWVITFVWDETKDDQDLMVDNVENALSPIYINYYVNTDDYISPEAYIAMAEYQQQFPETQNVQVLTDLTTAELTGYMINHMTAGLGVGCVYCHNLNNFAADEWDDPVAMENKTLARQHLQLTADLNQQWLEQLPTLTDTKQPSGAQITCAVCHNGEAQPVTWPEDLNALPDDFRLPLDGQFSVENDDEILNVNARADISLDTVQYNQYVMYHMNDSMGVGCTHCHNSRYFPSWEVPAKYYTVNMLQMSQFIWNEYGDTLNGKEPSCLMCHQGEVIPPGAARSAAVLPASLATQP